MTIPMNETVDTVDAKGLRATVNRLARKNSKMEMQVEILTRMLMVERVKSLDVDMSESLDLIDNYRPVLDRDEVYELRFSPQACDSWLAARRSS